MALLSNVLHADSSSAHATLSSLASLASSGVDVDFDASVLAHVAVFLVLLLVLKPLLFDPMLALFEERENRTVGTKGAAKALDEAAEKARVEVDTKMSSARADGNAARLAHRNAAAKEEAGILATAREESEKLSIAGRAANNVALDHAKKGLEAQAKELAALVASKALGREVGQ